MSITIAYFTAEIGIQIKFILPPIRIDMADWTVVLSSDDAKQIVLYNERDKQLAVRPVNDSLSDLLGPDSPVQVCALCKRPFCRPFDMKKEGLVGQRQRNYFDILREAFVAGEQQPKDHGRQYKQHGIPKAAINEGYYKKFFVELGRLGRGGGGSVYECEHVLNGTSLGRYAVKKVPVGDDTLWLDRLLREVHILESIRHENVIEYKHAWLEEHQPSRFAPMVPHLFILMECAEGGNLEDYLSDHLVVDLIALFKPITRGLLHLHSRGILHRDLKPSNILIKLTSSGPMNKQQSMVPVISDFGEASEMAQLSRGRTGATGTIEYMAPELLRQDTQTGHFLGEHSTASDVWSLGMLFYKCALGRLPYQSDDYDELVIGITGLKEKVNVPLNLEPDGLKNLIEQMLNVDPSKRPSVRAVLDVLEILDSAQPVMTRNLLLPPTKLLYMPRWLSEYEKLSCQLLSVIIFSYQIYSCHPRAVDMTLLFVNLLAITASLFISRLNWIAIFVQLTIYGIYSMTNSVCHAHN